MVTTFSQNSPPKHSPAGSRGGVQLVFAPVRPTFSSFMVYLQFMLPDYIPGPACCLVVSAAWCRLLPRPQALPPWLFSWPRVLDGCWLLLMATWGCQAPDGDLPAGFLCQHLFPSLVSVSWSLTFWYFWPLLLGGPS